MRSSGMCATWLQAPSDLPSANRGPDFFFDLCQVLLDVAAKPVAEDAGVDRLAASVHAGPQIVVPVLKRFGVQLRIDIAGDSANDAAGGGFSVLPDLVPETGFGWPTEKCSERQGQQEDEDE